MVARINHFIPSCAWDRNCFCRVVGVRPPYLYVVLMFSMRRILLNIGVAILSLAVFISLLEVGLRLTGRTTGQKPSPIYEKNSNPLIGYDLKPNMHVKAFGATITTDSHGFRSPEINSSKPVFVVMGDSVAFGYGVEDSETLSAQIQGRMPSLGIANAAVPGYSIIQEAAAYHEKVEPLKPSMLALVFYFNDFDDHTFVLDDKNLPRTSGWTPDQSCTRPSAGPFKYMPGHCYLLNHSVFYKTFFIFSAAVKGKIEQGKKQEASIQHANEDVVTRKEIEGYEKRFSDFSATLPLALKKFFIIWPDNRLHPFAVPRLISMAQAHGFTVINLYDTFGNKVPTLATDDVHPNPGAIARAADVITSVLMHDLLP